MEIIFTKEYLKELHIKGTSPDKHHRYQPSVIKRYQKTMVRVTDKYRIEFEEITAEGKEFVSICNILELSNHYN